MAAPEIRFKLGDYDWIPERQSVCFAGVTGVGSVDFLITSKALAALVGPEFAVSDGDMALEVFIEFETDIHRIARLEFVKRFGGKRPMVLTAADVAI